MTARKPDGVAETGTRTGDSTPTPRQRRLILFALLTSAFVIGVAFGGLTPLLALALEGRGVSAFMIGLNTAMSPIGGITTTLVVSVLIRRLGAVNTLLLGTAVATLATALLAVFDSLAVWFVLRLLIGVGVVMPWVVSETWINMVTANSSRGRVMAIYTMVLTLGFGAGPVTIAWTGSQEIGLYFIYAALVALSAMPVLRVRRMAPDMDVPEHTRLRKLLIAAPTAFGGVLLVGLTDAGIFSFLPLYGLRLGFGESQAVTLLSLFLVGTLVLQYPIGWLADHVGRRSMLLFCGATCTFCPMLVPFIYEHTAVLAVVIFIWGGGALSVYGLALAMLGDRFPAGQLTAANAGFIMVFEIASIIGPPPAGYSLTLLAPHGLMVFLAAIGAMFLILTTARGFVRRWAGNPGS